MAGDGELPQVGFSARLIEVAASAGIVKNKGKSINICILLDSDSFYYPFVGGIEKHCYELSRKLISKGINIFLISRKNDRFNETSFIPHLSNIENFYMKRIPPGGTFKGHGWNALIPMVEYIIRMIILLIKHNKSYDIIMISGFKILSFPAILVAILTNKKSILKIESPEELTTEVSEESLNTMSIVKSSKTIRFVNKARSVLLRKMDYIVAISEEIDGLLIKRGVKKHRIVIIPNGIDIDKLRPVKYEKKQTIRNKLSLPAEKTIFVYTGRLTYNKGIMLLVQAWEKVKKRYDDIYLLLIGPGKGSHRSCEEELRKFLNEHNLEDSVSITGEVADVTEYLQAADIFVFPSEYEGFSISLLEALACALPSIATRVGSAPEIIINRKNGILIRSRNELELEEAFYWLLSNKEQWAMIGNNARQSIIEQYSMDVVANKYVSLFEDLKGQLNP
jgi:glycosyltransferase involved in cell wall biosynthesis